VPELEQKIFINVSPERVFARLAEPECGPEWTPNLLKVERTSLVEAGPGLETRLLARLGGRESQGTGRCLAWDPPRSIVLETNLDVGVSSTTTFELTDQPPGTLMAAHVAYSLPAKGLGRLVGGLLGETLARRDLRKALENLKRQLEAEQSAS